MQPSDLLTRVKNNLILTFNDDDSLILELITAAISYAEDYQHLDKDYYSTNDMTETTKQAVTMLSSHFYESRDGSTGGFFSDSTNAAGNVWDTVNRLLAMDKEWKL